MVCIKWKWNDVIKGAKATEASGSVLFAFGYGNNTKRVKTSGVAGSHSHIFETNHAYLSIKTTYR
jgi:hypothetical protein